MRPCPLMLHATPPLTHWGSSSPSNWHSQTIQKSCSSRSRWSLKWLLSSCLRVWCYTNMVPAGLCGSWKPQSLKKKNGEQERNGMQLPSSPHSSQTPVWTPFLVCSYSSWRMERTAAQACGTATAQAWGTATAQACRTVPWPAGLPGLHVGSFCIHPAPQFYGESGISRFYTNNEQLFTVFIESSFVICWPPLLHGSGQNGLGCLEEY